MTTDFVRAKIVEYQGDLKGEGKGNKVVPKGWKNLESPSVLPKRLTFLNTKITLKNVE